MTAGNRSVFHGTLDDLVNAVSRIGIGVHEVQKCLGDGDQTQICLANGAFVNWWQTTGTLVVHGQPTPRDYVERRLFAELSLLPLPRPAKASRSRASAATRRPSEPPGHDLFLCHASEDKDAIARPLSTALRARSVSVWFDEDTLHLGDSLRRTIDRALARCRYGVVILSPRFFAKQWPQRELDGLAAKETSTGEKAILPIWHEVDRETVLRYSPPLADLVAGRSEEGTTALVEKILQVLAEERRVTEDRRRRTARS